MREIKTLAGLVQDDLGTVTSATRRADLDPGKKSAGTWVDHDPETKRANRQKWKVGLARPVRTV